jgi:RNA polymerase sigma factor (sigma-70 family)
MDQWSGKQKDPAGGNRRGHGLERVRITPDRLDLSEMTTCHSAFKGVTQSNMAPGAVEPTAPAFSCGSTRENERVDFSSSRFRSARPHRDNRCMTDATLAAEAKTSERAFAKLLKEKRGLIVEVAKRYRGRGVDSDDLDQIGEIALWEAVKSFDSSKGAFSTHAITLLEQHMWGAVRAIEDRRALVAAPVSLEQRKVDIACSEPPANAPEMQAAAVARLVERVDMGLTDMEREVLLARLRGQKLNVIAATRGVSERAIRFAEQRAKRKVAHAIATRAK